MPIPPPGAADDGILSRPDLTWRDRALATLPDLNTLAGVARLRPALVPGLISTSGSVFAMAAVPPRLADLAHSPLVMGAVGAV